VKTILKLFYLVVITVGSLAGMSGIIYLIGWGVAAATTSPRAFARLDANGIFAEGLMAIGLLSLLVLMMWIAEELFGRYLDRFIPKKWRK